MKKITPKQKKIIDIVMLCVQVVLVIIAITVSAIVIANPIVDSNEVSKGGTKLLPVLTDSMKGTGKDNFQEGDLIIAKKPKNVLNYAEGTIVTFVGTVEGADALITHRIVDIIKDDDGKAVTYITRGDNNPEEMTETINPYSVLAVYSTHMKGVGKSILWLQKPTNFLLVIVVPLVILFIYNIVIFVFMFMGAKVQTAKETAGATMAIDEEEIKRKAIEDYLASQNKVDKTDSK